MLAYLFVVIAVAVRFLPHPFAFTPVGASLLFFGARGPRRHLWLPLALLAASDVILTCSSTAIPSPGITSSPSRGTLPCYGSAPPCAKTPEPSESWVRPCRLDCIFPGEQLRRLGRLARPLSDDVRRTDNLLCRRPAFLPPRHRRRLILHRRHVRDARDPALAQPVVSKNQTIISPPLRNFMWGQPPSAVRRAQLDDPCFCEM